MPAPFRFLDRIDALVDGPASVATTARELTVPGGDRLVTRASDASRIPAADVLAHVREVALNVVRERIRDGLVDALRDHLDEVRLEHEMIEGPCPEEGEGSFRRDQWCVGMVTAMTASFRDGDLAPLGHEIIGNALMPDFSAEALADAVTRVPILDSDAVLARVGLTAAVLDEIVAKIRQVPLSVESDPDRVLTMDEALDLDARKLEAIGANDESCRYCNGNGWFYSDPDFGPCGCRNDIWSLARLAASWAFTGARDDAELFREAVTYVLTDPDTIGTGAELLGLADDEGFLAWARERAAFSCAPQDEADVAEVIRLAIKNADVAPAASQQAAVEQASEPVAVDQNATVNALAPTKPRSSPPVAAEPSDLTHAVGAALAVLYDHGCETDKAMAEALGVQKAVINQSRHNKTPWAPDADQRAALLDMVVRHLDALVAARDGLLEVK